MPHATPFATIIIPAFNEHTLLGACLEAAARQDYPADRFEIIVVDNGSEPPLALPAGLLVEPKVRLTIEAAPGSYAARNKGIRMAEGEILAFTDADCRPKADWLRRAIEHLAAMRTDAAQVGGRISITPKDPRAPKLAELYDMCFGLRQSRYVTEYGFAATANMVTTRRAFEIAGLFDARLKSSGDHEWGARAAIHGIDLGYCEAAEVIHPARAEITQILKQARRQVGGRREINRTPAYAHARHHGADRRLDLMADTAKRIEAIRDRHGVARTLGMLGILALIIAMRTFESTRLRLGRPPLR